MAHTDAVADMLTGAIRHDRPADHRFFKAMSELPPARLNNPEFLGQLYNFCQSVQHTLHVAAFKLPYLDTPQRKRQQMDILAGNDTNFFVLEDAFEEMKAVGMLPSEQFAGLSTLSKLTTVPLYRALDTIDRSYQGSLGGFVVSQRLLIDWFAAMTAVLDHPLVGISNSASATTLVQAVLDRQPALDGLILRGMQDAMTGWKTIWDLQYEFITGHVR